MKKYKTVIFDLDGTLLNTLEDLTDSVNHVLSSLRYPKRSEKEIRSFVGYGIHRLMEKALPEHMEEKDLEDACLAFKTYYSAHCRVKTRPYEDIPELLYRLKKAGLCLGIVSNKNDDPTKELKEHFFGDLIDTAVGTETGIRHKPEPDMVESAMKELDGMREQTVYVGDSEVDKATADNAGLDCILVSWGFRDRNDLEVLAPTKLVDSPLQIIDFLIEY